MNIHQSDTTAQVGSPLPPGEVGALGPVPAGPPFPQTPESARAWFVTHGVVVSIWCKKRGLSRNTVMALLSGRLKGKSKKTHDAAIALGLKPPATLRPENAALLAKIILVQQVLGDLDQFGVQVLEIDLKNPPVFRISNTETLPFKGRRINQGTVSGFDVRAFGADYKGCQIRWLDHSGGK